jgi:uncharacterized metal-binding protein
MGAVHLQRTQGNDIMHARACLVGCPGVGRNASSGDSVVQHDWCNAWCVTLVKLYTKMPITFRVLYEFSQTKVQGASTHRGGYG